MNDVNLHIRAAIQADAGALAHIQVDSYRTAYAGLLPQPYLDQFSYAEQTQDWRDLMAAPAESRLLVAEVGGALAGYILGRLGPPDEPVQRAEIVALHVRRSAQRKGIGRSLIRMMTRELQHAGCTAVFLSVLEANPAREFYERLGGRLAGQQQVELGEDITVTELVYVWDDIAVLCA